MKIQEKNLEPYHIVVSYKDFHVCSDDGKGLSKFPAMDEAITDILRRKIADTEESVNLQSFKEYADNFYAGLTHIITAKAEEEKKRAIHEGNKVELKKE